MRLLSKSGWIRTAFGLLIICGCVASAISGSGPAAASNGAAKPVEITFSGPGGPAAGPTDDVVRAFERWSRERNAKDPTKPVYSVISGQTAAYDQTADPTRFLISVAGGEPPDVIIFDRYAIAEWSARSAFLALDDYIAADERNNVRDRVRPEDFYKSCWDEAMYQGRIYGIPSGVDDRALVYNRDMLKQAGLVDPKTGEAKPPRTWEELREYNKKLSKRDEFGRLSVLGFAPNYGNSWLYMFGWLAGGEFMSKDGRTCTLNNPAIVYALTFMRDVYNDVGGYSQVMSFQAGFQGGFLDPFIQGKVAMKIDGSWQLTQLAQYGRDVDFGVVAPPMPAARIAAGDTESSWNGGWAYAIPVNARHKDAAWDFIRFFVSDTGFLVFAEGQRANAESQGFPYIPDNTPKPKMNELLFGKYVYPNPNVPERVKEGARVFLRLIPNARYRPITPVGQLLWNQQVFAMEEALYGHKTPKEALDYGTSVVQRDLNRFYAEKVGTQMRMSWFFVGYAFLLVLTVVSVYAWDTQAGFRRSLSRFFGRKVNVGEGDVVEGARGGYFRRQWGAGLLCVSPWLLGFLIFGGGPLLFSVVMSFCDYDVLSPARFTGLRNYQIMFTEDELVPISLWNTIYMLMRVPIGIVAGLAVALLLNLRLRGMQTFRTSFYLPSIVPGVAMFMLWIWIFNPVGGPLNELLKAFGFEGKDWLQDAGTSKPSLIIMGLWTIGGGMIIWLAGLQNIPEQLYEAASIDGASAWQKLLHITIPQLSPYIFFNLIMGLIAGFQIFDEAFIMTHGGPVNSTTFFVYHLFNNAFRYGHMGYACALAWVLFIFILIFTIIQMRFARKWVHYETE